jgi:hypothetical protein
MVICPALGWAVRPMVRPRSKAARLERVWGLGAEASQTQDRFLHKSRLLLMFVFRISGHLDFYCQCLRPQGLQGSVQAEEPIRNRHQSRRKERWTVV